MQEQLRHLATSLLCLALAGVANAGPNESGTLIIHAVEYQSRNAPPPCTFWDGLTDCGDARANLPSSFEPWAWFVVATFPEGSNPRLSGVTFGIEYDNSTVFLADWETCADFELTTGAWPDPGSGNAVTWNVPQTDQLIQVYAFVGYEYYGADTRFCLTPHPIHGGNFADDSVPSTLDPIADFGCLGFNADPGYLPCAGEPVEGPCCLPDGCRVLTETDCDAAGGTWIGPGVGCDPDPCPIPTREQSWGQIKTLFR